MTPAPEIRSLFDIPQDQALLEGLREITSLGSLEAEETVYPTPGPNFQNAPWERSLKDGGPLGEVSEKMFCSACQSSFENREEQMEHYKLDWHRFNLRQKLVGLPPATVEEFERKTGRGDVSSISGSDSEEESDSDDEWHLCDRKEYTTMDAKSSQEQNANRLSSRVLFQNNGGQYVSVYRCVLCSKKMSREANLASSLLSINNKAVWVVLMTGGGHFAGAVFQGKEVLQHKTFHRYTVRAKRGTAQGLRDSQNRSHVPKSAGAALRRYNEAALVKDVQDLLESWTEHLREASIIFLRAPSYNRTMFFSGRSASLHSNDPRVRTLPFPTRRATFREVKRVHEALSTLHVYGKDVELSGILSPTSRVWKRKPRLAAEINPDVQLQAAPVAGEVVSSQEEEEEVELKTVEESFSTLDLREHEVQPRRRRQKKKGSQKPTEEEAVPHESPKDTKAEPEEGDEKRRKRSRKPKKAIQEVLPAVVNISSNWEYGLRDALFTACKVGDLTALHTLLEQSNESDQQENENHYPSKTPAVQLLNVEIDSSGFTLLHVASAAGQRGVIKLLMDAGSDPACRDKKGQTPYCVAAEKDTRKAFRKYMADNPDKYDYTKAQFPGPITADTEAKKAEKKRAQKAQKKQREREQKEERRKEAEELEEKRQFVALSDREKRALAAERRLEQQLATACNDFSNIRRCWLCGESLLGKTPFQYLDFCFCSTRCVQEHRKANAKP